MRSRPFSGLGIAIALACVVVGPALAGVANAEGVILDRVVAVVNDEIVLQSEVEDAVRYDPRAQEAIQSLGSNPAPAQVERQMTEIRSRLLDELIDRKLVLEEAKKFQINVTDKDLELYLSNLAQQNGMQSIAELKSAVEETGEFGSWADYKKRTREDILWYQTQQVLATWNVTDAQVREYYRKMARGEDAKVEVVRFVFRPASDEPRARDAAYALAKKSVRRLTSGEAPEAVGADLEQSADSRRLSRGEIAPDLEDAIFAARKGEVIGPLQSGQGHVVFKIIRHHASDVVPFDQAKDKIRQQLESEAQIKAVEELNAQMRAKAHIDIRI